MSRRWIFLMDEVIQCQFQSVPSTVLYLTLFRWYVFHRKIFKTKNIRWLATKPLEPGKPSAHPTQPVVKFQVLHLKPEGHSFEESKVHILDGEERGSRTPSMLNWKKHIWTEEVVSGITLPGLTMQHCLSSPSSLKPFTPCILRPKLTLSGR